jgi:hypothetical protein
MVSNTEPSAMLLPFGKHKGRTVAEVLATDPQYAEWMLGQAWFAERFAELHAALLTRGAASDDTPEHNAIQARFLDPVFRAALGLSLPHGWCDIDLAKAAVQFEYQGIDVVLSAFGQPFHTIPGTRLSAGYGIREGLEDGFILTIEIKPSLGDDFPTVMRQMERLQAVALVIDQITGRLPLETVRSMFRANGRLLITVREIEAEIANARALVSS